LDEPERWLNETEEEVRTRREIKIGIPGKIKNSEKISEFNEKIRVKELDSEQLAAIMNNLKSLWRAYQELGKKMKPYVL